jgi:hypothetical protein
MAFAPLPNHPGTPKLNAESPSTPETASARRGEGQRGGHGGTGQVTSGWSCEEEG